jgi:hypothetical protein
MPPLITHVLLVAFTSGAVLVAYDGWRTHARPIFWIETVLLVAAFLVLRWQTGFPSVRQSFSGTPTAMTVAVMFICVVCGTVANYFYYQRGSFSLKSLIRPVVVSPLVLLPLLGTLEGRSEIESVQLIWFALLAFQNGFFWRVVFDRAAPAAK